MVEEGKESQLEEGRHRGGRSGVNFVSVLMESRSMGREAKKKLVHWMTILHFCRCFQRTTL